MCDGEDSAAGETSPYSLLYQSISLWVYGGCGLIQYEYLCLLEQGSSQTDQLLLSHTKFRKLISSNQREGTVFHNFFLPMLKAHYSAEIPWCLMSLQAISNHHCWWSADQVLSVLTGAPDTSSYIISYYLALSAYIPLTSGCHHSRSKGSWALLPEMKRTFSD